MWLQAARQRKGLPGRQAGGRLQHFVGAGANAEVAGEIDPANGAGGVDEKFSGAGDVAATDAGAFVQDIVAPDDFGIGVGEERIRIPGLATQVRGFSGRVNADGDRLDS